VRVYYAPLEPRILDRNIAGVIQITRTLKDIEVTLSWLRLVLIGIGIISLFFATATGYMLSTVLPIRAGDFAYTICGGYKWLLAPRGTCFFTIAPELMETLIPHTAGWYAGAARRRGRQGSRTRAPSPHHKRHA